MKSLWVVLGVVGLLIVAAALCGRQLCELEESDGRRRTRRWQAAFSNIDVDLQRRADLIPNLVATVKGYANVEESILTTIANARAGLMTAKTPDEKLAANDRLNVALLPLMRMQENYPQLKSNDQFMRLQDELAGTENRIAVSRRGTTRRFEDYNMFIQQFPNSIWANFAGFHPKNEYYTAEPGSQTAPKVDFSK